MNYRHAGALVSYLFLVLAAQGQTTYIGPASGNWGDAANWSAGVPTATDNVVIDTRGQNSTVATGVNVTRSALNLDINAGDRLIIDNNTFLNLLGNSLSIDGLLVLQSTSRFTALQINGNMALAGSGSLLLNGSGNDVVRSTGSLLNSATIAGRGAVGANQLAITNDPTGLIDANVFEANLVVDPPATGLSNQGTLRASNGGRLQLAGGDFGNASGTILATGAGSEVQLLEGARITGGIIRTTAGGLFRGTDNTNYFFTDVTFDTDAQVLGGNNSDFGVAGTMTNNGTVTMAATSRLTDIELQGNTLWAGNGEIVLGVDNNFARIGGSGILTNTANHTIRGRGNLGTNAIGIINEGTVTADRGLAGAVLLIDPSTAGNFDNNGLLQAVNGGILQLGAGNYDNTSGVIQAIGEGSVVQLLEGASITGGIIRTENGGSIRGSDSTNYFFTDVIFEGDAQVIVGNNSDFGVVGTMTNNGTVTVAATSRFTDIELQGDAIWAGNGEIVLGVDNNFARIEGSGILTNTANHTIRGRGNLGANVIGIINEGTVTADRGLAGAVLLIDPPTTGNVDNNGLLQAVNGGILELAAGNYDNSDGVIQAIGEGSEVRLLEGAFITGGIIRTENGGRIRGNDSTNYFFTDVTFETDTQVQGGNNSDFGVVGTMTNNGTVTIAATSRFTDIELQGDTIWTGNGEIVLGVDNNFARIDGAGILTNSVNHTIRGRGNIGANTIGIVNEGMITAEPGENAILLIDPSAEGNLVNKATIQASNGGVLQFTGFQGGSFDNQDGLIQAAGPGSEVQLLEGTVITGGILHTEDGGLIRGTDSTNYFFTDVTFDAGTQVRGGNNSDFGVVGTITNNGTITMAATSRVTDIELQDDTVFDGNGRIILGIGILDGRINGSGTLTNGAGHTIQGQGNVGAGELSVFNAPNAVITANVNETRLVLDPITGDQTFRNRGTLAAEGGGLLQFTGAGGGGFDNLGGTIRADGAGSEVQLVAGAFIEGGTFETENGGVLRVPVSNTIALSDVSITGDSIIDNNATLMFQGEVNHSGNLSIRGSSRSTGVLIDSFLDLQGSGTIELTSANSNIRGNGVLINHDHQISGLGNIGVNEAAITNTAGGTLHANAAGTLTLDPNAFLGLTNDGVMRASNGGTLSLDGNAGSEFAIGETGVLEALDGGTVSHTRNPVLTNLENGILSVGTYRAIDEGNGATLNLPGGDVLTNAASIELSGAGAEFGNLVNLTENVGRLALLNGATLNTAGGFTQSASGTLEIGINGTPSDDGLWGKIVEAGAATLDGTLDVLFNVGSTFTAAVGDTWKVFTSAIRTGEFANVNVTAEGLPANSEVAVNYVADGVELTVVGTAGLKQRGTTYEDWAKALPEGNDADPDADPDKDGVSNLQEYAFAMDPMASDADLLPIPHLARQEGARFLAISYERPSGEFARTDITYRVEMSTDLQHWTSEGLLTETEDAEQEGIEHVTARCPDAVGKAMEYLRVVVTP